MLFLNSSLDRETPDYTALDFVDAIRSACSGSYSEEGRARVSLRVFELCSIADLTRRWQRWDARDLISHVVYIQEGEVQVDTLALEVRFLKGLSLDSLTNRSSSLLAVSRRRLHPPFTAQPAL